MTLTTAKIQLTPVAINLKYSFPIHLNLHLCTAVLLQHPACPSVKDAAKS